VLSTDGCQILQDELSALSLASAGFATDDDALILLCSTHQSVTIVSNCEDMRWKFSNLLLLVGLDLFCRVDGQNLIRIDGYQNGACVCLKKKKRSRIWISFSLKFVGFFSKLSHINQVFVVAN